LPFSFLCYRFEMADTNEPKKETANEREERILRFWEENKIFAKSLEKPARPDDFGRSGGESPKGEFIFYEGPPTANGKPGIHHLEARAFKDVILRYKTMCGHHVRRKGGWDTHGLPVELQVEKKLGLNSKKAIEDYGIAQFNKECKESVWEYLDDWQKFTTRIGFWIDQEHPYVTYENSYIESVWNVLKTVEEKKLLYKDYKVVPWCPRCGTALSSHELGQIDAYKEVKDLSVYAKFKVVGKENTYILAWTTTPWTLPGNVALAVGAEIDYMSVHVAKVNGEHAAIREGDTYIFAATEDADVRILGGPVVHPMGDQSVGTLALGAVTIELDNIRDFKGKDLVGLEYEPLYPFTAEQVEGDQKAALTKAYKVYAADFVTTTDGTGVVHTAVMYGADDFELGTKIGLPKHHLVTLTGTFVEGTGFLEGRFVKDEAVAVDIIKDLAHRGLLFKKEKYEHAYPHCWRCQTPLIYYARDSWYIRMSSLRDKLVEENQSINWEPAYIRDGRFGEWLREIKDWAISRERYWGTPLPIWANESGERVVIGSIDELKAHTKKSGNTYLLMRHGQAASNLQAVVTCDPIGPQLTAEGKAKAADAGKFIQDKYAKVDVIIASDLLRTRETAQIVAEQVGYPVEKIQFDPRLRELNFGAYNNESIPVYHGHYTNELERFQVKPEGGETLADVKQRITELVYELERTHVGKTILIVSHGDPLWLLHAGVRGMTPEEIVASESAVQHGSDAPVEIRHHKKYDNLPYLQNAEVVTLNFVPLPHNEQYELDLHRPYIDALALVSDAGEPMTRVKEVMDVWFDSGAMPFAQDHYPFGVQEPIYPADYICEAVDQTRGWFYTLHAVGILMGRGKAYKNVICLGLILDAKGKKMSKSIGNVVDPWLMMEKYGVDTLRLWMYSVNQPGDAKNFDEKTVAEVHNKVFNLLYNVLAFYEMYAGGKGVRNLLREAPYGSFRQKVPDTFSAPNVLDQWILARLNEVARSVTKQLDTYRTLEPVRGLREFIDDLSTWYVRRSRERLKDGDEHARQTLRYVLFTLAKLFAPFAPFAAEDLWLRLKGELDPESVHLAEWPGGEGQEAGDKSQESILEEMQRVREIVTMALEARSEAGIKVRQPLASLRLQATSYKLQAEFLELIKDEVNVKEVVYVENLSTPVELDTALTPELEEEGRLRELMRAIQDLRKEKGLQAHELIALTLPENYKGLVQKYEAELKKGVKAMRVTFAEQAEPSLELVHDK